MNMPARSPNATYWSATLKSYVPGRGCSDAHLSAFSGVVALNCALMMASPSVSRPENCAALRATPTRKVPSKAPRSVRGAGAQAPTSATRLRSLDDIQDDTAEVRRAAAHHDVEPPRFHHALHVGAMVGQVLWPEVESDRSGLTRLQRHAPESAQLRDRPRGPAHGVADVELHHLVTGPFPGVGYVDRDARPIPGGGPDPGGRHAQVRVRERGVRQAVAEGEQRRRGVEQVSPPGRWLAVIEHGKLSHMAGDGDGELAARIDVAEQGLRHGSAGFLTEVPSIENRGDAVY